MKNRKRTIFILGAVLGGVLLIAAAVCLFMVPTLSVFPAIDLSTLTPDQKRTLDSIEKIDNHPLYTMTYYGDYSQFLKLKDKYYKQLGLPDPRCSTFAALNQDGDAVLGYNSDSGKASYLLLFTNPPVGYKSVSVVHISEAFGLSSLVTLDTLQQKALMLYSPFFTNNTGMNEMGFSYAVMAAPGSKAAPVDPAKDSMNNGELQRYLLDNAKTVDEAVGILEKNNVCFTGDANHWLLADASGHSAVVEWVDGNLRVLRNTVPWQVCTNFILTGAQGRIDGTIDELGRIGQIAGDVNGLSYFRYATAWNTLKESDGSVMPQDAMGILRSISLTQGKDVWYDTQYSIVYNLKTREFRIVLDKNYGHTMTFSLNGTD